MQKKTQVQLLIELIWLVIIALVCAAILFPIVSKGEYKFTLINSFYVIITVLYARFFIQFKDIDYLQKKWIRVFIFLINFHFIIYSAIRLQDIVPLWEGQNIFAFVYQLYRDVDLNGRNWLLNYVRNEVMFFGIATIVVSVFLNVKILGSFFGKNSLRKTAMLKDLS